MEVRGQFQVINNRFTGFDEEGATVLGLYPDAIGNVVKSHYRGNIFENCYALVKEGNPGIWKTAITQNNLAINCVKEIPKQDSDNEIG